MAEFKSAYGPKYVFFLYTTTGISTAKQTVTRANYGFQDFQQTVDIE
jgi:hypothetical protein